MKSLSPKNLFGMKIFSIVLSGFIILFGFNLLKEYNKNLQLNAEIKKLEAAAKDIEAKNLEILNLAEYLDTEEFLEKEARTKMGLKKPGEQAIIINGPGFGASTSSSAGVLKKFSNPVKWWKYFFGKN